MLVSHERVVLNISYEAEESFDSQFSSRLGLLLKRYPFSNSQHILHPAPNILLLSSSCMVFL
jgi:hypothetical protein